MPEELAFAVVPVLVIGFIVLAAVAVAMVAVILSRVIRLARGGPAADQLRQQLAQRPHTQLHDGHTAAMHAHQTFMDMQQQTAVDIANSTATIGNPANNSAPPV